MELAREFRQGRLDAESLHTIERMGMLIADEYLRSMEERQKAELTGRIVAQAIAAQFKQLFSKK